MKRVILVLTVVVFGSLLVSAQSLADAARQARATKAKTSAEHVYTNDDIASQQAFAVEKLPDDANQGATEAGSDTANADSKAKAEAKETEKGRKDGKDEAAAKIAAYKKKVEDQKKAIADQEHEIGLMEREHQIRVAEYYADAGTQLRTGEKWFQDEKKYQDDLAAKKKALSDAKTKLDELSEQARKVGVPMSEL